MRLSLLMALAVFGLVTTSAEAQYRARSIAQFCPKTEQVGSESATIYKNSAPLRANPTYGAPIVGYRYEPTLIFNKRNFTGSSFTIYDGKGNSLARCPYATAVNHQGRARCTAQTASVRRAAVKNTGSPTIYFKISQNLCVSVPDAGRCYGSVKGPCDRLVK